VDSMTNVNKTFVQTIRDKEKAIKDKDSIIKDKESLV